MKKNIHFAQHGQSLLEVIIGLVLGVTVATAFISLAVVAVARSRFAADQVTATKLAQEGVEAMVAMRDENGAGAIDTPVTQWSDMYSQSLSCASAGDYTTACAFDYVLQDAAACPAIPGPPASTQRCIRNNTNPYASATWQVSGNTTFSRKIRIVDGGTNVKTVTVFVWWKDSNGLHQSILSRNIYRDKLQ